MNELTPDVIPAEPTMDPMADQMLPRGSVVQRETPEIDDGQKARVSQWVERVQNAKKYWAKAFKSMRDWQYVARHGAQKEWVEAGLYRAQIVQRHINQTVASMYARNPRAYVKLKKRLETTIWDGEAASLEQAMMQMQQPMLDPMTGMATVDPQAMAIIQDAMQAKQTRDMLTRIGKTLEILYNYYLDEQEPKFKTQMKQAIRRMRVNGVAYVEMGYQRLMDTDPSIERQIEDVKRQIDEIQRLTADVADGELQPGTADAEKLRVMLDQLQQKQYVIVREGLVFDFPASTAVIPDPNTVHLKGWIGTNWLAKEVFKTADEIKRDYQIDIGRDFKAYHEEGNASGVYKARPEGDRSEQDKACLWVVKDKETLTEFTICDGYPGYLRPPAAPSVMLERFFNIWALSVNDSEDGDNPFPISDVELLWPMQDEYNRARQGLREHRRANRPGYATSKGKMTQADKDELVERPANMIVELQALGTGEDVAKLLQPLPTVPIDPNLYEVEGIFSDILRTTGAQEANLGGTSGDTATESSIAEQSRGTSLQSGVDDLDELLSDLARCGSQILLMNCTQETAKKIAGPGAMWPELDRQTLMDEIYLDIKAGSSGRPNAAAELAKLERAMPFVLQLPGQNPKPYGERYLELLDLDVDGAIIDGLPSITAINAMARPAAVQPGTGDPRTDPAQQGGQGGNNAPQPAQNEPQSQPLYPAPGQMAPGMPTG